MNKNTVRQQYRLLRAKLSEEERLEKSIQIANLALKLPCWNLTYFHLFLSSEKLIEVDTEPLMSVLLGKDKQLIVPKMEKENRLTHYLLTDATPIQKNAFGIAEPQGGIAVKETQIEVVFIPLLAFDESGHRLGYGKGYYDRFLARCSSECIKIGLSFFKPEKQLPFEATDIPLDFCITPTRIYSFN
jgi:5-formyltetrahydrofolate cyclo-ligase